MANEREIKNRIKSIQDTLKITNAMYLIASSKLKKSRKMLADTEPYFYTLQREMKRILKDVPDINDIYFKSNKDIPDDKLKVAYVVVTADKGLAGEYNHNILKMTQQQLKIHPNAKLFVLGETGRQYFESHKMPIEKQFHYTVQNPTLSRARSMTEELLSVYLDGTVDEINVIYTRMGAHSAEYTEMTKVLPQEKENFKYSEEENKIHENISFKPSAEEVMHAIIPEYLVGFIYGMLVEAYSCEHNARMTAMKSASESARDMLSSLNTEYNRARQAAITQMITEVAAGAKAQNK